MALADLQPRLGGPRRGARRRRGRRSACSTTASVTAVAAGVANLRTGVEATPDTVFQIGSQGKMWTATVLMQLVDEGLVDIDATGADVSARVRRRRSGGVRGGDAAPPALAHQRDRRRQLRRLRPRRRLPRTLRRVVRHARADPSARRHDVVLQHRLLDPRPGDRGRHRQGVGRRDARAPVRAARARPTRARCPRRRCSTGPRSATSSPRPAPRWRSPRCGCCHGRAARWG